MSSYIYMNDKLFKTKVLPDIFLLASLCCAGPAVDVINPCAYLK